MMIALFMIMCSGCTSHLPNRSHWIPNYGKSYHAVFSAQIANPSAPENPSSMVSLDGRLASDIYRKSIKKLISEEKSDENLSDKLR